MIKGFSFIKAVIYDKMVATLFESRRQMWTNPQLHWLAARRAWPSVRQTIAFGGMLWAISAAVMLNQVQPIAGWVLWAIMLTTALITIAGSLTAAVLLTTNELQRERLQLLKLANLSEAVLVQSYAFNALYHLRALVVI